MSNWFPQWRPYAGSIEARPVGTNEYLPPAQSAVLGIQHAFAMFGATVLAPFLMGFDPNLAILMSGLCTILFFFMTGGRVPSYLGSSFAFIGVVIAATGYAASGTGAPNANIALAAGGIMACGVLYAIFGLIVMATGTRWIEKLMPPVVTGAVVMIIGLNLAPVTVKGVMGSSFNMWMSLVTVLCMGSIAVFTKGLMQRLLLLLGQVVTRDCAANSSSWACQPKGQSSRISPTSSAAMPVQSRKPTDPSTSMASSTKPSPSQCQWVSPSNRAVMTCRPCHLC